ncbi:hypothetical protein OCU_35850 [Mycobacterium intracellulare ATCC 13950]|uniref:Uncharacterized protein n=1 Tax=Mycobacterium intracellulare (strain ATCC 13950 / DSM 43223 / JCM 6384 / NCTC 13025 / 3600) TaxID=487521 RepID=H8IHZ7_MYCIA|nr:hypothetical protein OCU_35850 [Mycobacterium intracellulare ATCC 13950]ETZ33400.1 hypothetical protein L843_3886 [Mycobacterium intracellulare MIN_061107_1834]
MSVVAWHRVKPGPGACCDAGPGRKIRSGPPGTRLRSPRGTGDAMRTREVSPRTSCDQQFTPVRRVLLPRFPRRRRRPQCRCGRVAWPGGPR